MEKIGAEESGAECGRGEAGGVLKGDVFGVDVMKEMLAGGCKRKWRMGERARERESESEIKR